MFHCFCQRPKWLERHFLSLNFGNNRNICAHRGVTIKAECEMWERKGKCDLPVSSLKFKSLSYLRDLDQDFTDVLNKWKLHINLKPFFSKCDAVNDTINAWILHTMQKQISFKWRILPVNESKKLSGLYKGWVHRQEFVSIEATCE